MEAFFFFLLAAIAVVSAILLVLFRNPVYCALSLVTTFFCLAGLFVLLDAYFLAAVQIIVYAGAIMVLFLFVIMLLNLGHSGAVEPVVSRYRRTSVILLAVMLLAEVGMMGARRLGAPAPEEGALFTENIPYIGRLLYTDYLFPFEVASFILLVALIGVMVLVKRQPEADGGQPAAQTGAQEPA